MNAQTALGKTFVFREPNNADELLALLRLRYTAFRQSRLKGFVKEHPDQLDIDPWDARSMHYGLFHRRDGHDEPIGYIRVVGFSRTVQWQLLVDSASRFEIARTALGREPEAPLPILSYDDPNRALWNEYEKIIAAGLSLVEPGRIAMLPEYRSMAVCRHLVESAIALYFFGPHIVARALVSCARDHSTFYQRFGFRLIPGSENACAKVSWILSGLVASPDDVPATIQQRAQAMARQFESTGEIVRGSSSPYLPSQTNSVDSVSTETSLMGQHSTEGVNVGIAASHKSVRTKSESPGRHVKSVLQSSNGVSITIPAILRATAIIAMTVLLPIAGAPSLLIHPKIIFLIVTGYVMLLSQHELRKDDAEQSKETDKGSVLMILISAIASQILPLIEWAYFGPDHAGNLIVTVIGLILIAGGLGLRIWAIRAMGQFFTVTVQILPDHQVIKHGPFAIVRHPCYLGAIMTLIGTGVFLNAPVGAAIGALITISAYGLRMKAEERLMREALGTEYETYQRSTPMVIPNYRKWVCNINRTLSATSIRVSADAVSSPNR